MTLFFVAALAAVASAYSSIQLGYGVKLQARANADLCLATIAIDAKQASEQCVVEFFVDSERAYQLYWKRVDPTGAVDFKLTDLLAPAVAGSTRFEGACKLAGTYAVAFNASGVSLGDDTISAVVRQRSTYTIDLARRAKTGQLQLGQGGWAVLRFAVDANATAQFIVDRCSACAADQYTVFYQAAGGDVTADSSRLALVTAGDRFAIAGLAAGSYDVGIFVNASVKATTTFAVAFDVDESAIEVQPFPQLSCPAAMCGAKQLDSCSQCTKNGCEWCEATSSCSNGAVPCAAATKAESQCRNMEKYCASFGSCFGCSQDASCVWCERNYPLSSSCSSGKNDLALECDSDVAMPIKLKEKCTAVATCDKVDNCKACASIRECAWCESTTKCVSAEEAVETQCAAGDKNAVLPVFGKDGPSKCKIKCNDASLVSCQSCLAVEDNACEWRLNSKLCVDRAANSTAAANGDSVSDGKSCSAALLKQKDELCHAATSCTACTNLRNTTDCLWCTPLVGNAACHAVKCPSETDRKREVCSQCTDATPTLCPSLAASLSALSAAVAAVVAALALLI